MPTGSNHFFFVLGTYKPRIRCYDTYQLSLKFERCLDSDGKFLDSGFAQLQLLDSD